MQREFNLSTLIDTSELKYGNFIIKGNYWKLKMIVFSCIVSFSWSILLNRGYVYENFRGFYADVILHNPQPFYFWNSIIEQGKAPLQARHFESGSHEANRTFRFTIPIISRIFRLNSLGLYLLQNVLGFFTLYLLSTIISQILGDRILTFYSIFALVNVYVGSGFFFNCFGHGDTYTFFFLSAALLCRNPIYLTAIIQLAFWCDERSVVTIGGIWIFQYLYFRLNRKASIKLLWVIATNVLIYILVRLYLATTYHLVSEDVETLAIERYWYFIKYISLWYGKRSYMGVEGYSLLLLITFMILFYEKKYYQTVVSVVYWLPILMISFLVGDTVRTLSFTFVFWIAALLFLKERLRQNQLKTLLLVIAFINFLIPTSFP